MNNIIVYTIGDLDIQSEKERKQGKKSGEKHKWREKWYVRETDRDAKIEIYVEERYETSKYRATPI